MKTVMCMITKNSAGCIEHTLESTKGKFNSLVVVDSFSTDGTVKIIKNWCRKNKVKCNIYANEWNDDFSEQRNICLNHAREIYGVAKGNACGENDRWVYFCDDDDAIETYKKETVESSICRFDMSAVYSIMFTGNGKFATVRMFRLTSSVHYTYPIHEVPVIEGVIGNLPEGSFDIRYGNAQKKRDDVLRNVRIERKCIEKYPNEPRYRIYLARDIVFNPAVPLQMRLAEAEGNIRKYLSMSAFLEERRLAIIILSKILSIEGRRDEAKKELLDYIKEDPMNEAAYKALSNLTTGNESKNWKKLYINVSCDSFPYTEFIPLPEKDTVEVNTVHNYKPLFYGSTSKTLY